MLYPVEPWVYNARPLASHRPVGASLSGINGLSILPQSYALMRQSLVRRAFPSFRAVNATLRSAFLLVQSGTLPRDRLRDVFILA